MKEMARTRGGRTGEILALVLWGSEFWGPLVIKESGKSREVRRERIRQGLPPIFPHVCVLGYTQWYSGRTPDSVLRDHSMWGSGDNIQYD